MPTPLEEMQIVAKRLEPLGVPFAFVGGAVMCLLVDNPKVIQFRRTKDVDVIVAVVSYKQFSSLEERLRQHGFNHDTSEGAPICRWIIDGCKVDIMPMEPSSLGMNTRWFSEALRLAESKDLGNGCFAKVVSKPLFLATKLEAFKDRGKGDFYASHDLEDIITLVDGCAAIAAEVGNTEPDVKAFISRGFEAILEHPDFSECLPGHRADFRSTGIRGIPGQTANPFAQRAPAQASVVRIHEWSICEIRESRQPRSNRTTPVAAPTASHRQTSRPTRGPGRKMGQELVSSY
jgi:hypothetical protein